MSNEKFTDGMDLQKLEAFRKTLEESPVTLGLQSRSVWEGHSGRNTTHIGPFRLGGDYIDRETRRYTFQYGAWKEVEEVMGCEGPTDRVEPVEMVLGAMGACLSNSIGLNAARQGIKLEGMEITVKTEVDPSVLFELKGPEAHTSCMPRVTCDVKVKGDLNDEQMATIKRLIAHSLVHGLVADPP
ncbi:MAG: OsmC family protein [Xanthomonadales bacterium]|nr:OsmC family protein [Xanthomonadales bacterium]